MAHLDREAASDRFGVRFLKCPVFKKSVSSVFCRKRAELGELDAGAEHINDGEFVSIMGPSGSGKSTLLHLIGGLDTPDRGEVLVGKHQFSKMQADEITIFRRHKIGFVFQFFNLLPTLTAEENVALPLLLDGRGIKDIRTRVRDMLELVGLSRRSGHKPDEMSGGEMQRTAIARALVIEPLLLLADEPTGNLDSLAGDQILNLIKTTAEQRRLTVIMVTHDAKAASYGDRLVMLRDGRIASDDDALSLRAGGTR